MEKRLKKEWSNVWVSQRLNKDVREKRREEVEEAKEKNVGGVEEAARHFPYKVEWCEGHHGTQAGGGGGGSRFSHKNVCENVKLKTTDSNVDGLVSEVSEFRDVMLEEKPEVIGLTD